MSIKSFDFRPFLLLFLTRNRKADSRVLYWTPSFSKRVKADLYKYLVFGHEAAYFVKGHSDFPKQVSWRWYYQDARSVSGRQYFRGLCEKGFQADSRHSNGIKLRSLLEDIFLHLYGIHAVFALDVKEAICISLQTHVQVHWWWFVHKQPSLWELPRPDLSFWRQDRKSAASYLDLLLPTGRDGKLHSSINNKREYISISIYNKLSDPPFPSSAIPFSLAYCVFITQLIRYARACSS